MRDLITSRRLAASACTVALIFGAPGCGNAKPDLPLTMVSGKVTLDAAPLVEAVISFIPSGSTLGLGGSARTDGEGRYSAVTPSGDKGLPAGEYQVVISKQELPKGAAPPPPEATRADSPYRETLSRAYSDPTMTKLKATVPSGGESTSNFELKAGK